MKIDLTDVFLLGLAGFLFAAWLGSGQTNEELIAEAKKCDVGGMQFIYEDALLPGINDTTGRIVVCVPSKGRSTSQPMTFEQAVKATK